MNLDAGTVSEAGRRLALNPDCLIECDISVLSSKAFGAVAKILEPGGCYVNAITVATILTEVESVIFGAVFNQGVWFEHCWVRTVSGCDFDPTYQALEGRLGQEFNPQADYRYFELFSVAVDGYLALSEELRGEPDMAIDFRVLRTSPQLSHLFAGRGL